MLYNEIPWIPWGYEIKNTYVENYIRFLERKISAIIPWGLETPIEEKKAIALVLTFKA